MGQQSFETELVQKIAELAAIAPERVRRDVPLRELGVDSLMVLEIVSFIDRRLDRKTADSEIAKVRTLSDILDRVADAPKPVGFLSTASGTGQSDVIERIAAATAGARSTRQWKDLGLGLPAPMQDELSAEARVRVEVVRWVLDGHTIQAAAERFKQHRQTIATWVRRYRDRGPAGLEITHRKHSSIPVRVRELVAEALLQHPEWSKRPMARWLAEHGYTLPLSTVHQLVREVEPRVRLENGELLYFMVSPVDLGHRDARVTGDFVNWSAEGIPLERNENGVVLRGMSFSGFWSLALQLPPGEYRCRFILDGNTVVMLPDSGNNPRGMPHRGVGFSVPYDSTEQPIRCVLCVIPGDSANRPAGTPIRTV